jgi:DNA (cytosine-5)-methyltransferase 1
MARIKPTALSLFSGIGGFCEGVKLAGFQVLGAVEKDRYAAENYRLNFPDTPLFEGDITDFFAAKREEIWKDHFKAYVGTGELDLLFGGPPCQGYSQIGPRDPADPRNELYLEVCRIAKILSPKFILLENVPNMIQMKNGMFKKRIIQALQSIGYDNIAICLLKAEEFGVPQKRRRIFIMATRSSKLSEDLQVFFDDAISSLKCEATTVDQAIGDLPELVAPDSGIALRYPELDFDLTSPFQREMRLDRQGVIYSVESKLSHYKSIDQVALLHNHHTKEIQERRLNLIQLLEPGKKADSLPKEVWNNARPEKWRRLNSCEPAYTLLAQMHRDLSEWVHPKHHRWITVREALRLQSFHDGFILRTSEWQQLKQVGNAVPPLLARAAANAVASALVFEESKILPSKVLTQLCLFDPAASSA